MKKPVIPQVSESAATYVIGLVSVMFLAWAALLIAAPFAAHATPVAPEVSLLRLRVVAVAVLIGSAVLAEVVMWLPRSPWHLHEPARYLVLALLPQQFLLLVSAFGGIRAAVLGHYADGTIRPWTFIVADQFPVLLLTLIYTVAMVTLGQGRDPEARPGR